MSKVSKSGKDGKEISYIELSADKEVTELDTKYILEGMYLNTELYLKLGRSYILFCKNVYVDAATRKWILEKVLLTSNPLYVLRPGYDSIREQYDVFRHLNAITTINENDSPEVIEKKTIMKDFNSMDTNLKTILETSEDHGDELNEKLNDIAAHLNEKISDTDISILLQCINDIRRADGYLYTHSKNVSMLSGIIGKWMKLGNQEVNKLLYAGLVHDLGKLRVSQEILNKPARLTDEEFEEIKKHSRYSYEMLKEMGITDDIVLQAVRGHHERGDGGGYPDGLKGQSIPLFARILAVADVYDAMIAKRVYKDSHTPFEIMAEFARNKFKELDGGVVQVFLDNMPEFFLNKKVLLSNGRYGVIKSINKTDYEFPIVELDGKLVKTSSFLRCVSVDLAEILNS